MANILKFKFSMESLKEKLEKYRKNSKKKKDYYLVGEIKHNDKKIFELLRDEDENYYVKKIFEKPNEHFTRELLCMIDACDRGFPFVPLIEFDDQNEYGKSYIITPFMEGSNVVRQIIDKNKDDSFSEKDSSDIYLSTDLPHLAQIPIKPIDLNDTRKMIIIYGTAKAISFLHLQDRQIIHRDIKPENVLLDENGEPRLSDFGFARLINQKEFMSSIKGTLPYIAPELVREEKVDVKADIYSFGVFMIFLINEKLTFKEKGIDFNFYTLNKKKTNGIGNKRRKI